MSAKKRLEEGGVAAFSSRPVGLTTNLFLQGGEHDSVAVWHIELCCKPENNIVIDPGAQIKIDISSAAGAIVTVRNEGWAEFTAWTDY